ncbi:uncharacterized protein EI90DRAFT_3019788 [Cantharellus anzutake]|uniref:uncharacterized protein n=1 Tax=Cantharellus anzutake TaxID=1750568 RepID=UPI0019056218|nr:uncharacterized protein EI90DRAFT_3019788 [Cantharellus anzutake]KAF8323607.1 hypothetical protein EI90DRAFT_3019788 [Cantharellus anzutake]
MPACMSGMHPSLLLAFRWTRTSTVYLNQSPQAVALGAVLMTRALDKDKVLHKHRRWRIRKSTPEPATTVLLVWGLRVTPPILISSRTVHAREANVAWAGGEAYRAQYMAQQASWRCIYHVLLQLRCLDSELRQLVFFGHLNQGTSEGNIRGEHNTGTEDPSRDICKNLLTTRKRGSRRKRQHVDFGWRFRGTRTTNTAVTAGPGLPERVPTLRGCIPKSRMVMFPLLSSIAIWLLSIQTGREISGTALKSRGRSPMVDVGNFDNPATSNTATIEEKCRACGFVEPSVTGDDLTTKHLRQLGNIIHEEGVMMMERMEGKVPSMNDVSGVPNPGSPTLSLRTNAPTDHTTGEHPYG